MIIYAKYQFDRKVIDGWSKEFQYPLNMVLLRSAKTLSDFLVAGLGTMKLYLREINFRYEIDKELPELVREKYETNIPAWINACKGRLVYRRGTLIYPESE
jgi:hypothetical protein